MTLGKLSVCLGFGTVEEEIIFIKNEDKPYFKALILYPIKMDLREIGWGGGVVEWIHLAKVRDRWRALVIAVMNLRVLAPRS
jgi:hypothetical protein